MNETTDYTAHIQLPDAQIGTMFHEMLTELNLETVTFSALRVGGSTWLSIGLRAGSDDAATMIIGAIKYTVSKLGQPKLIPDGYDNDIVSLFETATTVVTSGRTVIHSEGV